MELVAYHQQMLGELFNYLSCLQKVGILYNQTEFIYAVFSSGMQMKVQTICRTRETAKTSVMLYLLLETSIFQNVWDMGVTTMVLEDERCLHI